MSTPESTKRYTPRKLDATLTTKVAILHPIQLMAQVQRRSHSAIARLQSGLAALGSVIVICLVLVACSGPSGPSPVTSPSGAVTSVPAPSPSGAVTSVPAPSPSGAVTPVPAPSVTEVAVGAPPAGCTGESPRAGALLVSDNFKRDAPGALGSTETGQAWTPLIGALGIQQGVVKGLEPEHNVVVVDAGTPNVVMEAALVGDPNTAPGLAIRMSSLHHYLRLYLNGPSELVLLKAGDSGSVVLGRGAVQAQEGAPLRIALVGACLMVSYNDQPVLQAEDSFNATATQHGLWLPRATAGATRFSIWAAS